MSADLYDIYGTTAVFLTEHERALEAEKYQPQASRRCLICADINPCLRHTYAAQQQELVRNDAAIFALRVEP